MNDDALLMIDPPPDGEAARQPIVDALSYGFFAAAVGAVSAAWFGNIHAREFFHPSPAIFFGGAAFLCATIAWWRMAADRPVSARRASWVGIMAALLVAICAGVDVFLTILRDSGAGGMFPTGAIGMDAVKYASIGGFAHFLTVLPFAFIGWAASWIYWRRLLPSRRRSFARPPGSSKMLRVLRDCTIRHETLVFVAFITASWSACLLLTLLGGSRSGASVVAPIALANAASAAGFWKMIAVSKRAPGGPVTILKAAAIGILVPAGGAVLIFAGMVAVTFFADYRSIEGGAPFGPVVGYLGMIVVMYAFSFGFTIIAFSIALTLVFRRIALSPFRRGAVISAPAPAPT